VRSNATIKLYRLDPRWASSSSWYYKVLIDGVNVGELWNRQIRSFQVDPGVHEVRIKGSPLLPLLGLTSLTISVDESQTVVLFCPFWLGFAKLREATQKDIARMQNIVVKPSAPRNLGEQVSESPSVG